MAALTVLFFAELIARARPLRRELVPGPPTSSTSPAECGRIVDVMEELVKFTHLTRARSAYPTDRYSERVESAEQLSKRVNQRSI